MKNDGNDKNRAYREGSNLSGRRVTAEDVRISMSKNSAKKKSNKRIITAVLIVSLTCLVALAIVDIVFFNVENIIVSGNSMYTSEEILESTNIKEGTNFLAIRPGYVEESVKTAIPGISEVKVVRRLPSTVELKIVESTPVMYITVGEFFYTLDENMVVLQKFSSFDDIEMLGLIRVYFSEVSRCVAGDYIVTQDKDVTEMIKKLYGELEGYGFLSEVMEIDFSNKFDIEFTLGVKYTVKLGNIIDCDIKLEFLQGILEELDENEVGTIDFSKGDIREAIFSRGQ